MEKFIKVTMQINMVVLGILDMLYIIAGMTCRTDEVLQYMSAVIAIAIVMVVNAKIGIVMMGVFKKREKVKKAIEE